jgi:hypothetical protein
MENDSQYWRILKKNNVLNAARRLQANLRWPSGQPTAGPRGQQLD